MCYDEDFMIVVERKFMKFMACSASGIRKDYLKKQVSRIRKETSLDNFPAEIIGNFVWHDVLFSEDIYQLENEDLLDILEQLTTRQKEIIIKILFEQQTETEVAEDLGITQQGVNLSKNKAIKKLKHLMKRS